MNSSFLPRFPSLVEKKTTKTQRVFCVTNQSITIVSVSSSSKLWFTMTSDSTSSAASCASTAESAARESKKPCQWLVVDSGGFIRNAPLRYLGDLRRPLTWAATVMTSPSLCSRSLGDRVVTLRDVVAEIRDKATKQRLQVLPYELEYREPDTEDIRHGEATERELGGVYLCFYGPQLTRKARDTGIWP